MNCKQKLLPFRKLSIHHVVTSAPGRRKEVQSVLEIWRDSLLQAKEQTPQCGIAAKLGLEIAINIVTDPFYMTRVAMMDHMNDKITINTNLLLSGSAVATTVGAGKADAVLFVMPRLY